MSDSPRPHDPAARCSYPEVGATRAWPLPAGYHHLRVRTPVGRGAAAYEAAGAAVLGWRMHSAAGVSIRASGPEAAPGVVVEVGLGVGPVRLRAPCVVVWTVADGRADERAGEWRTGFGYGTLPGHPESGEESFLVSLSPDGLVALTVTAFSRPASLLSRAAGPLVPPFQRAYARRCGAALRRLVARDAT